MLFFITLNSVPGFCHVSSLHSIGLHSVIILKASFISLEIKSTLSLNTHYSLNSKIRKGRLSVFDQVPDINKAVVLRIGQAAEAGQGLGLCVFTVFPR